jgi:hypothetical protein
LRIIDSSSVCSNEPPRRAASFSFLVDHDRIAAGGQDRRCEPVSFASGVGQQSDRNYTQRTTVVQHSERILDKTADLLEAQRFMVQGA